MTTEQSIAHYRITEKIGEGGMGEVYRATDTKLQREVALKILPDHFAEDPARMARFSREARMLASLNHPNIAAIYGLEESEGKRALVMELVEGDTLAHRLERGPVPLEETLTIAKQMAEGLEEAHERGIIHRDVKPANVKVTPNGTVKLLDFGLAKALEGESGVSSSPDLSQSPTLSAMTTAAGMILGTAAYMSPEQARGQKVDRRSDIWSFGLVLYEMLSGKQAFGGDTVTDVLASVLKTDLDISALPEATPTSVCQLVRRCLVRDPKQRLQSIGDARITIADVLAKPELPQVIAISRKPTAALLRRVIPWALYTVTAAALALALWLGAREPSVGESPMRLSVEVAERPLYVGIGASAVLSPDGTRLALVVGDDNKRELRVRSLHDLDGSSVASGAGVGAAPYNPFFSPDSEWLGYVTASELRKVPVTGGTSQTICKVERSRGASWGPDDTIVFAPNPQSGLFRVSAAGGEPKRVTTLDPAKGEATHRWPQLLPGGRAVLFTTHTRPTGDFAEASLEVVVLETGERKVVQRGGSYGRYLPSGHLVYVTDGSIFAVPFDLGKLEVEGSPAPVVQDVAYDVADGGAQFSVSDTGRLAVVQGESTVPEYPVVWVDRKGAMSSLWNERGSYANPRLSPDGKRLSLTVLRDGNWDIWVYDLERGVPTRLTFDESAESEQIWSPDGEKLVFSSDQSGPDNLYLKRADGSGETERLSEGDRPQWSTSWSRDGRFLAFITTEAAFDIYVLPLDGDRHPEKFLGTPFRESSPGFSPDGRWLAYDSNESGRLEVYVRPFPSRAGKWQISDGGGTFPKWSSDGRELYYRTDSGIMVAPVEGTGDSFRAGKPRVLFEGAFRGGTGGLALAAYSFADYDVTADGQRFVMFPGADPSGEAEHPHITLVTHWFDELYRAFSRGRD